MNWMTDGQTNWPLGQIKRTPFLLTFSIGARWMACLVLYITALHLHTRACRHWVGREPLTFGKSLVSRLTVSTGALVVRWRWRARCFNSLWWPMWNCSLIADRIVSLYQFRRSCLLIGLGSSKSKLIDQFVQSCYPALKAFSLGGKN